MTIPVSKLRPLAALSRRELLVAGSAAVGAASLRLSPAHAAVAAGPLRDAVATAALDAARQAGAEFADVRVVLRRDRSIATREARVRGIDESASLGFNVRALVKGAWGFSASDVMSVDEAARVARRAVEMAKACAPFTEQPVEFAPEPAHKASWKTPIKRDPFEVPTNEIVAKLLAANALAMNLPGVKFANSSLHFVHESKLFMSSEGARIDQDHYRLNPSLSVTATAKGDFRERSADLPLLSAGYEVVDEIDWQKSAGFAATEAVAYLKAKPVKPGVKDIVLLPSNLWLTLHESVGHPTELDRALGYEANYAGTSFCTVDKLNKLEYGSGLVNLVADRTIDRGLATVGYDDEGVAAQDWHIVKDGKFVGYQTTREQAGWIGEKRSRGCSYGQAWNKVPFQRIPNLHLEAGKEKVSKNDLVSGIEDGIVVDGRGSWSIDHQRYNFQFTGGSFWEIKKGKVTERVRDVAYQSNSLDFWRSCDGIGGKDTWEMHGTFYDGKGEPPQSNACSHGCPVARFRKVNILNTAEAKS